MRVIGIHEPSMQSEERAREGHGGDTAAPNPAEEARQVIETETRCHRAETKEPAFLIAMRYTSDLGTFPNIALLSSVQHYCVYLPLLD